MKTGAIAHNLGFPCIGIDRKMKKTVESYWRGELSQADLLKMGKELQSANWKTEAAAGLDLIPISFSWYDRVLDMSALFGVIPERFKLGAGQPVDIDTYFCMARGLAPNGKEAAACEMTKWFDTNYHYIVPEFVKDQSFYLGAETLFNNVAHAKELGYPAKPVLVGPLSYLWLGKAKGESFDKLKLLDKLLPMYQQVLQRLAQQGVEWVQMDEPILGLDLPPAWQQAFSKAYQQLASTTAQTTPKLLLATYFSGLGDNAQVTCQLPVAGLHIDLQSDPNQLDVVLKMLPNDKILSLGVINGRNIWRADLQEALQILQKAKAALGNENRLWVAPSCSLLHVPVDLDQEPGLDPELQSWLAFAKQKVEEVVLLTRGINHGVAAIQAQLAANQGILNQRGQSQKIHNKTVKDRVNQLDQQAGSRKNIYQKRAPLQREALSLPLFPTTTIGSFPQTQDIRSIRHNFKTGKISHTTYEQGMRDSIAEVVRKQEALDIDVLVHGEAERNDMVEYFGELLNGFAFTSQGWVQSYGSRCVKPPIIFGDVSRLEPMTVSWSQYAQSLTSRHMKGMLTGPVTILAWSFVRDDQEESATALQIALALRDEVVDLETAGIKVIQIDEPAFRELLPLRRKDWQHYLDWAVFAFRVSSCGVQDTTQIHTHMCYSEFNDIIEAIAALDADVITLESSRSDMELLEAFEKFDYPNEIGPGVYDIHSPRVPSTEEIVDRLNKALKYLPKERLWVNPDCGLKTRGWPEVEKALTHMVEAAKALRKLHAKSEALA